MTNCPKHKSLRFAARHSVSGLAVRAFLFSGARTASQPHGVNTPQGVGGMMDKSPAFQWYPRDILSSARVQELSLEEEGAYRRLLDFCWLNGSIPADPERCARLIGKGASTCIASAVQKLFTPHADDPTLLIHDRLEKEREKQEANRNKKKAAADARWSGKTAKNDAKPVQSISSRNAGALQMECSSSASSSSSATAVEETRAGDSPSPVYEALEEIYPGSATNFRTMWEMFDLAERLHATPEQVRNFPAWLAEKHPRKSDGPFAFRDLFPQSLKNGNGHHATPAKVPTHNCPKCKDLGVFTQNGQMVRCDCWQKEAA